MNDIQQRWIENNPCMFCGKPLNKPFNRLRKHAQYILLRKMGSGGSPKTHKIANSLTGKGLYVGECCFHVLTQEAEECTNSQCYCDEVADCEIFKSDLEKTLEESQ